MKKVSYGWDEYSLWQWLVILPGVVVYVIWRALVYAVTGKKLD